MKPLHRGKSCLGHLNICKQLDLLSLRCLSQSTQHMTSLIRHQRTNRRRLQSISIITWCHSAFLCSRAEHFFIDHCVSLKQSRTLLPVYQWNINLSHLLRPLSVPVNIKINQLCHSISNLWYIAYKLCVSYGSGRPHPVTVPFPTSIHPLND